MPRREKHHCIENRVPEKGVSSFEIDLVFRRADFEAIYFGNGYDRILTNPQTRRLAYTAIVVGIIWAVVLIDTVYAHHSQLIFLALTGVFAITIARLRKRVAPILRWKKEIRVFFDRLESYKHCSLLVTDESFTLTQDTETGTDRWSAVRKTEITEDYISITASTDYLFPRNSMQEAEFERLKAVVLEKTTY